MCHSAVEALICVDCCTSSRSAVVDRVDQSADGCGADKRADWNQSLRLSLEWYQWDATDVYQWKQHGWHAQR